LNFVTSRRKGSEEYHNKSAAKQANANIENAMEHKPRGDRIIPLR
jgi:hypothetical protein